MDDNYTQAPVCYRVTLDEWLASTALDDSFLPHDINHVREVVYQIDEKSVDTVTDAAGLDLVHRVRPKYEGENLGIVCKLSYGRFLSRTFSPRRNAKFLVLDGNVPDLVVQQFEWSLLFFFSNFGYGRPGGCCMPSTSEVQFMCWTSSQGDYAVIAGPAEHGVIGHGFVSMPTARVYCNIDATVQELQIGIPGRDEAGEVVPAWPAAVAFDPRPGRQHEFTAICSTQSTFTLSTWWKEGLILRYDLEQKLVTSVYQRFAMTGHTLQYLSGGRQVACVEPETYDSADLDERELQRVWVFDTDTLTPLYTVKPYRKSTADRGSIIALYSADESFLAMILWKITVGRDRGKSIDGNVVVSKNPLPKKMEKLENICRVIILRFTRGEHLDQLPLPPRILSFIKGDPLTNA